MTDKKLTAREALARLEKLSNATITATSPQGRVKVAMTGTAYTVLLRPAGFQSADPQALASEVVHAYAGVLRGYRQAEEAVMSEYDDVTPPNAGRGEEILRERAKLAVAVVSPGRMVRGEWNGLDDITLRVQRVNDSHRAKLETELGYVLTELSERYGAAVRDILRRIIVDTVRRAGSGM